MLGAIGALVILFYGKKFTVGSDTIKGDVYILLNSFSWALYIVLVKPLMQKYNTFTVLKWVFLFGLMWLFLFGLIYALLFGTSFYQPIDFSSFDYKIWVKVLLFVLTTTFFVYILNTYALKELSPSVVSFYIYLQPFIASLIAIYIYQNDTLDMRKLTGGALIIFGFYLVSMRLNRIKQ
jgi:drug/metabolite transporter (DMT)-like permease